MTAFLNKSFAVAEKRSDVPDREKQEHWAGTFGNLCRECCALEWAQTPMRHEKCPVVGCPEWYCREHKDAHMQAHKEGGQ